VRLGATTLLGRVEADATDRRTYDLAAPLNVALADHPTPASRVVPLVVSSVVPGILTVYPPEIAFDLPP
jgi:hypothetical protein